MKRILLLLLLSGSAVAQLPRYDAVVQPAGTPFGPATVAVCQSGGSGGPPCSPLAVVYSDPNGNGQIAQPFQTDINGHFYFYAPAATYAVQTYGTGYSTNLTNITLQGGSGGGGSGLPTGCTGTTGQITCSVFSTSNSNGGISANEGNASALTAASGVDLLWADSTAHRWKANVNNGGAQTVAFLSDISNVTASALTFHMISNVMCCTSGTTFGAVAPSGITNTGTATNILATSTEHTYMQTASGTTAGNQAGWGDNAADWFTGRNLYWSAFIKDANSDLTNQILWMGMTNGITVSNYNTNTPGTTIPLMMFRFSSTAPDTDWQCVTGSGSAQTTTDSGVAANTSGHFFAIQWINASTVNFYIDAALVCTNTTNVPAANTQMGEVEIITTQTAAAKNLQMAWMSAHMDY